MPPANGPIEEPRENLYTILNLPVSATQDVIRHRYKELAVIFHPDRQSHRDEKTIKRAERHFQDISRAHEILTNPEMRRIYDTLGEAGLIAYKAVGHRNTSPDKLRTDFERLVSEARGASQWSSSSSGQLTCAFDLADAVGRGHPSGIHGLSTRTKGIKPTYLNVTHNMEMNIDRETQVSLSGVISAMAHLRSPRDYGNVVGTIRHQFSPKLQFEVTANLLRSHAATIKASYRDDENEAAFRSVFSTKNAVLPPMSLQIQRKLFVNSLVRGVLAFYMEAQPRFSTEIHSPLRPRGSVEWRAGFDLSRYPTLTMELKTRPLSGGFRAGLGAELGLASLLSTVTGQWTDGRKNVVAVTIGAGKGSVFVNITFERLGQRIFVPIVLSHEVDELIGIATLLVPTALAALVHNFVVKPRVRARRISKLHAARDSRDDSISRQREEATKTVTLLSESAQRRAEHERSIGGLVVLTAEYIASGDDDIPISVDVTVPVQALVHESQLIIPGGRSKAGLLGFYDPAPGSRKRLKVEYLFHDRMHVVDVGDFAQVMLPLRGHLVG